MTCFLLPTCPITFLHPYISSPSPSFLFPSPSPRIVHLQWLSAHICSIIPRRKSRNEISRLSCVYPFILIVFCIVRTADKVKICKGVRSVIANVVGGCSSTQYSSMQPRSALAHQLQPNSPLAISHMVFGTSHLVFKPYTHNIQYIHVLYWLS